MLTVVAILLLPVVLGMSVYRLFNIPRAFCLNQIQLNRRILVIATFGFGLTYLLLLTYTGFIVYTVVKTIVNPPETIYEVFSLTKVSVGYPIIYLCFEWTVYHCLKPRFLATPPDLQ